MYRRFIVVVLLLLISCLTPAATTSKPVRVACRLGQPPINDADSVKSTQCVGYFADVFYRAASAINMNYTMTMIDQSDLDPLLQIDANNNSVYDLIIAFHTVTPARLLLYDFSIAVMQSSDMVALRPTFTAASGDIIDSVVRRSVVYVFALLSIMAVAMAVPLLVFESQHESSDMRRVAPWRRPLWSLEMGFETVMTFSTSEALSSQAMRTLRLLIATTGVFLIVILGALITSKLTSSSITNAAATANLRGAHIAIASVTVKSYLESLRIGAKTTTVQNLHDFAEGFYNGGHKDYDGFCTSTEVVTYLHNLFDGDSKGFTLTSPLFVTGTYSLKAFPASSTLDPAIADAFNIQLQSMRESGVLANLYLQYIIAPSGSGSGIPDIPINADAQIAFITVNSILYGLALLLVVVTCGYHKIYKPYLRRKSVAEGEDDDGNENDEKKEKEKEQQHTHGGEMVPVSPAGGATPTTFSHSRRRPSDVSVHSTLVWKGRAYNVTAKEFTMTLDLVVQKIANKEF
eukprot:PhF_6_TR4466/c0_g1_i4/m.6079